MLHETLPFALVMAGMTLLALTGLDVVEYAHFLFSLVWR